MKIRTRLSLLFVLCSTVSLLLCGVLLLCASAKTAIRSVENNAVSELNMLTTSFSSAAWMVLLALVRSRRKPQTSRLAVEQRMNRSESRTRIFMAPSPADTRSWARKRWEDRFSF